MLVLAARPALARPAARLIARPTSRAATRPAAGPLARRAPAPAAGKAAGGRAAAAGPRVENAIPAPTPSSRPASRARVLARVRAAGSSSDAGMATAEYAVATVAACGFGGVLYKVITNDAVLSAIGKLVAKALTLTF